MYPTIPERPELVAGTCIPCGAPYGSPHYSWCKFETSTPCHRGPAARVCAFDVALAEVDVDTAELLAVTA